LTTDSPVAVAFLAAAALVCAEVRAGILADCGYRCSAGLSLQRHLSKSLSACFKPNQQALLLPSAAVPFLGCLKVSKLRGFGGKLGTRLRAYFSVDRVAELWPASIADLTRCLNGDAEGARYVHAALRGGGSDAALVRKRTAPGMLMSQKVFYPAATTAEALNRWLLVLSRDLVNRIADCREVYHCGPHTLSIRLGTEAYSSMDNILTTSLPLTPDASFEQILQIARTATARPMKAHPSVTVITMVATRMRPVEVATGGGPGGSGVKLEGGHSAGATVRTQSTLEGWMAPRAASAPDGGANLTVVRHRSRRSDARVPPPAAGGPSGRRRPRDVSSSAALGAGSTVDVDDDSTSVADGGSDGDEGSSRADSVEVEKDPGQPPTVGARWRPRSGDTTVSAASAGQKRSPSSNVAAPRHAAEADEEIVID
jgi:hypothetical protein